MATSDRRELKPGELFAIDPKYLQQTDRGAFFWLFGSSIEKNEMHDGGVAVVHIRDTLDHHEGFGDSYDGIVKRVQSALDGDDDCKEWDQLAEWRGIDNMTKERPEPTPAKTIVLSIDSPGGVVSGLNQTVEKLRRMCKEKGVPLIAFANEKACSAAYALACACDKIYAPPSAIIGSIGVRSMMCDTTRADKKAGIQYVLIASGDRKLDGDPHAPISDAAVKEEYGRVEYLAKQFFQLVGSARGERLSADAARALQANVFIGKKAQKAGLIDAVMGWDALLAMLAKGASGTEKKESLARGGSTMTSSTVSASTHASERKEIPMRLTAQIKKVKAAIAAESDAKKKAKLEAKLAALRTDDLVLAAAEGLKKTKYKHEVEEETTEEEEKEETDPPEEEETDDDKDPDSEDDKPEKKEEKKTGKKEEKDPEETDDDKDPDSEDDKPEKKEEDEDDAEEAIAALVGGLKGAAKAKAEGLLSALFDKASAFDKLQPQVAQLKATEETRKRDALIDSALKERRITKAHGKMLRGKKLAFVTDFLSMHKKPLYFTQDDADVPRDALGNATVDHSSVPREVLEIINASVFVQAPGDPKKQEELRSASIKSWRESQNGARH